MSANVFALILILERVRNLQHVVEQRFRVFAVAVFPGVYPGDSGGLSPGTHLTAALCLPDYLLGGRSGLPV